MMAYHMNSVQCSTSPFMMLYYLFKRWAFGALLAKTDLENAYKQVPIYPDDFELLGFQINNEFYYDDKTLPFGLSYSYNLFEKFSSFLQ